METYHMQNREREITDKGEVWAIIEGGRYATLSLCRGNEPYVVTLNYGPDPRTKALYFHCALKGLKLEFVRENSKVCGTVIEDRGYLMSKCSHAYTSAVFWGRMTIVSDPEGKRHALAVMIDHLEDDPDAVKDRLLKNKEVTDGVGILRLDIKTISGKKGN